MVDNILTTLSRLKGVHHACLYRHNKELTSNFPEHQNIDMLAKKVDQIFTSLQTSNKSHNELYFSAEEHFLAAFLIYDSYIAILLTDKSINFPLVRMGIRAASLKIEYQTELTSDKYNPTDSKGIDKNQSSSDKPLNTSEADTELEPIMKQLLEELIDYFGPAAKFVLEDALIQWEVHYVKNLDNVPELCKILIKEMESAKEKDEFTNFVNRALLNNLQ